MSPSKTLSLTRARQIACHAQGLNASTAATSLHDVVESTGFVRTLGGVDVYLALRARYPQLERAALDASVAQGEFQVIPAARGCIYLVPRSQAVPALRLADSLTRKRSQREFEKVGLAQQELDDLAELVIDTLSRSGPLTTAALRRELPEGAIRNLGDIGKKIGLSSPLPPALRQLEFAGRIARTPPEGRLDNERYLWHLSSEPLPDMAEDAVHAEICRLFFRAAGLATRKQFAAWSGLNQTAAKAAIAANGLLEIQIEGEKDPVFISQDGLEAPDDAAARPVFLPFEDNLIALRSGPAFFVEPEFHGLPVPVWGRGKGSTLGDVKHSTLRSIVWREKLVGFWEFDPDSEGIVHHCFDALGKAAQRKLAEEAEDLTRFIVDQLGHGRSFSLDKDDDLRRRAEQIRTM